MEKNNFSGVFTALVTPFKKNEIDEVSLRALVRQQIEGGVNGLVVNGTTAESPTLSEMEVLECFNIVQSEVPQDVFVVVGTGSNSTQKTIEATQRAEELGADAALVVVPYYNKPTQEGLFEHFKSVAENTNLDIILYNVPGRTVTDLKPETVARLSEIKNIKAIKDATGDISVAKQIFKLCPDDFALLSGDDATYLNLIHSGGVGVISVISNLIPTECCKWNQQALKKDPLGKEEFKAYEKLVGLLFKEPNPVPTKAALKMMKIIESDEVRLPLVTCSETLRNEIELCLKELKII